MQVSTPRWLMHWFEVYPTPDGEVAIDAPGGFGRSVILLCESDGSALCLVNLNAKHRYARYADAPEAPDSFVRGALLELAGAADHPDSAPDTHPGEPADTAMSDALIDLGEVETEAQEEDWPMPSAAAFRNAQGLVRAMHDISPRRFEVYPTPDGAIAIDAPGGYRRSVIVFCDSDGSALCSVMDGRHRRARYSDAAGLPDGFVRDALVELDDLASG